MYVYITLIYYIIQNTFYNDLGTLSFKQDSSGNWGYCIGGADTVNPFKKASDFNLSGQLCSYDGQSDGVPSHITIPTFGKSKLVINKFKYDSSSRYDVSVRGDIYGLLSDGTQKTIMSVTTKSANIAAGTEYDISMYESIKVRYLVVNDIYNSWQSTCAVNITLTD